MMLNKRGNSFCFPFCCCQVAFFMHLSFLFAICSAKFLFIHITGCPSCLLNIIIVHQLGLFQLQTVLGYRILAIWILEAEWSGWGFGPLCADFTDLWIFLFNRNAGIEMVSFQFLNIYWNSTLYPNLEPIKTHT